MGTVLITSPSLTSFPNGNGVIFPHLRWYQHSDEEEEDVDGLGLLVLAQQEDNLVLGL